MTGYERIRATAPYRIKRIEDVRMEWKPNEHARLYLRGVVDDSEKVNAVLQAASDDEIHLYDSDGKTETTIFKGIVTSVQIAHTQGVYAIELEGQSGSFQLDVTKKRRSFQQAEMTYPKLVQEVIKTYPGHNVTTSIGEGVQIGEPIIQYDETDWELLKRLASHFHAVLVSDIMEATPRFSFGLPQGKSYTLPDDVAYTASKDLLAYQKAGGDAAGLHDTDFFTYEIESGEPYAIGDEIWFRNKRMVVSEVRARMERGLFVYTYRLSRIDGIRQGRIHNAKLSGVSLEGKVLAVKGEQVKLHLDIDKQQPKETAYWFPFAPPTGNVMYCMPQVGTSASLYFPDATGKQAVVLGCVRKNGDSCAKTGNPNIRYFGTEHGSELELAPTALTIVSGCKEPLKLTLDDHVGITLTSHKKLVLNAKEEISLYTPKRIVIQAQSQILAKKTSAPSGFSLESEYHFLGAAVHVEGRDRTTFPAYDDEPQQGTPPPPEPPFDWGKLAVCVVAAVAIVGAVALTVATFGAGAVIGAAAVGAALGAIGGVVMTASSDLINGEASSPYEYIKSAAQGAVIGAVCGAIFGPVAGIGGGAVVPLTGGQTTVGIGSAMFMGGASGYIDYSLRELWDGRTPDGGKALESFAFGAALGGAFSVGASWLAKGAERVNGALKRGASSGVEGKRKGKESRLEELRAKYGRLSTTELHQRINLRGAVHDELHRLMKSGLTKKELGPAVAGVLDKKSGKYYFDINDPEGKVPLTQHKVISERIEGMPPEIEKGYIKSLGAGSHAEVKALNRALLDRPDANLEDFMIYVISARKINKKMPVGTPMPRCPHCEYITQGANFIPEVLKHRHGR
ncbi:YwqJ-related putative deaminase [Brevibacillus agri]|uniref:YwqJ-related putative deaminase n=2 Tax=Brevibacillus agri TaxID=51101 RepID=UPI002E1D8DBC|nr:YwqJ-related putative deaminase [Brevibacillus agri]